MLAQNKEAGGGGGGVAKNLEDNTGSQLDELWRKICRKRDKNGSVTGF